MSVPRDVSGLLQARFSQYDSTQIFVAGGAAVDFEKANDIDVWILTSEKPEIPDGEPFGEGFLDYLGARGIMGAWNAGFWGSKKVHVFWVPGQSPQQVVMGFDLSTHAVGILPDGTEVRSPNATTPHQAPQVTRWTTPKNTMMRYCRICLRYGHPIDNEIITRLAQSVGPR
jgi:hypothetical protein